METIADFLMLPAPLGHSPSSDDEASRHLEKRTKGNDVHRLHHDINELHAKVAQLSAEKVEFQAVIDKFKDAYQTDVDRMCAENEQLKAVVAKQNARICELEAALTASKACLQSGGQQKGAQSVSCTEQTAKSATVKTKHVSGCQTYIGAVVGGAAAAAAGPCGVLPPPPPPPPRPTSKGPFGNRAPYPDMSNDVRRKIDDLLRDRNIKIVGVPGSALRDTTKATANALVAIQIKLPQGAVVRRLARAAPGVVNGAVLVCCRNAQDAFELKKGIADNKSAGLRAFPDVDPAERAARATRAKFNTVFTTLIKPNQYPYKWEGPHRTVLKVLLPNANGVGEWQAIAEPVGPSAGPSGSSAPSQGA